MTDPKTNRARASNAQKNITRRTALGVAATMASVITLATQSPLHAQNAQANRKKVKRYLENKAKREAAEPSQSWIDSILPGNGNATPSKPQAPATALLLSARNCLEQGIKAKSYCLERIAAGDDSVKPCLKTIEAMLPVCGALAKLEEIKAKRLKEMAKLATSFLTDCQRACQKQSKAHIQLSGCAIACAACAQECKNTLRS